MRATTIHSDCAILADERSALRRLWLLHLAMILSGRIESWRGLQHSPFLFENAPLVLWEPNMAGSMKKHGRRLQVR